MRRSSAWALLLVGAMVVLAGLGYASVCSWPSDAGCLDYGYAWSGLEVAAGGGVLFAAGALGWWITRDDERLVSAGFCPVCRQPVVLDPSKGSWYCPSCAKYR